MRGVLEECVADPRLVTPGVVERQYQLSRIQGTTWALYSTFRHAEGTRRLREHLSRIDHPTLLVWGEKDLILPPTVAEALHREIRGSRLLIIRDSGHIPMWETPEPVNQAILAFLAEPEEAKPTGQGGQGTGGRAWRNQHRRASNGP